MAVVTSVANVVPMGPVPVPRVMLVPAPLMPAVTSHPVVSTVKLAFSTWLNASSWYTEASSMSTVSAAATSVVMASWASVRFALGYQTTR